MNLAKAGRPRIAWYCDSMSTTSNSSRSFLKLPGLPKMTSIEILPRGSAGSVGMTPWNCVYVFAKASWGYPHDLQGACKQEVQAASSVHEDFAHVKPTDLGIDYQCRVAWSREGWWMVILTEVDRLLGPVDVFGIHAGFGKVDFPCEFLHLPLGWVRLVNHRHVPARRWECFGCTMLDLKVLLRMNELH